MDDGTVSPTAREDVCGERARPGGCARRVKGAMGEMKLAMLPEDLLAHVMRFAIGGARRGASVRLEDWRYAAVSRSFRRAFRKHLTALVLDSPRAATVAALRWAPVSHCTQLRRLVVTQRAAVSDAELAVLFRTLKGVGARLQEFEIDLSRSVTQAAVLDLVHHFGESISKLAVTVVWVRRVRRRLLEALHPPAVYVDPPPQFQAAMPMDIGFLLQHEDVLPHFHGGPPAVGVPQVPMNGMPIAPVLPDAFGEALPGGAQAELPHPPAGAWQNAVQAEGAANALGPALLPNPGAAPVQPPAPQLLMPYAIPSQSMDQPRLTDDTFATILARVPNLKELRIEGARLLTNVGIVALSKCPQLESLALKGSTLVTDDGLTVVVSKMEKLRKLQVIGMTRIGDATVRALALGAPRQTFQALELSSSSIVDDSIRDLVNGCALLETVSFEHCSNISKLTASHLSCARSLQGITLKSQFFGRQTDRAIVHLSCASSMLRSLRLSDCRYLGIDGINALKKLPGLRTLHLLGLPMLAKDVMSCEDVMRVLGSFPRLEDLVLDGQMHLTDLGVQMLVCGRGYRLANLALADDAKTLSDEALDYISTWCRSLRCLEVHGRFTEGEMTRMHEHFPKATVKLVSPGAGPRYPPY